jgi:hypothetical protein
MFVKKGKFRRNPSSFLPQIMEGTFGRGGGRLGEYPASPAVELSSKKKGF